MVTSAGNGGRKSGEFRETYVAAHCDTATLSQAGDASPEGAETSGEVESS